MLTLLVVVGPFISVVVAVVLLWGHGVGWLDLALMAVLHVIAASGITVGFHRMLTHRSFASGPVVRAVFTAFGLLAIEGRPVHWVADHRKHHAFSDQDGDPHSPHAGRRPGVPGLIRALWHAHVGWLFTETDTPVERYAPDLLRDRVVMRVDRMFPLAPVVALVLPFVLGFALSGGRPAAALSALLWAGGVRIFLTHHVTWSVNSICHMYGRSPFNTGDHSTNNWLLALPTLGEAWHHNHHAFPTSAFHGLRRRQAALDPSGWLIRIMEKLGLVWDVKRISPDQIAKKLRAAADAGKPPRPALHGR